MSQQQLSVFNSSQDNSLVINQNQSSLLRGLTGPSQGNQFDVSEFYYYDARVTPTIGANRPYPYATTVINNLDLQLNVLPGLTGTSMTISVPGVYQIIYGTSLAASGAIGVYTMDRDTGSATSFEAGGGTLVPDSVAGSTTVTTWITGTQILNIDKPKYVGICSVGGSSTVAVAGGLSNGAAVVNVQVQKLV